MPVLAVDQVDGNIWTSTSGSELSKAPVERQGWAHSRSSGLLGLNGCY
jgi:hypothetical protein